ncbi:MAG: hypothetical protein IJ980_07035 [Oscillospiraceae bacterium]|nr:hypothetical protein [Oscillospiraceae bacterium]
MGLARNWTREEELFLEDHWGTMSVNNICRQLRRSRNAIMVRVNRLGLPPYFESGEYITMNQLIQALGYSAGGGSYKVKSWIKNRGFPVSNKKHSQKVVRVVYLDAFWEWAEKNRSFLDFSKMEPLALGEEPDWLVEQRKKDAKAFSLQRKDPWTPGEDHQLARLLREHKYGYAELSAILNRSAGAIQRRCTDLGLKERPVKADNHSAESKWTERDYEILAEGIRNGDSYTVIGNAIGKSEKAVRGKVYFVYLTENADKVRAYLGDDPWGYGAPEPTVRQARHLSRTRTETQAMLEQLAGVLRYRTLELKKGDYDNYFQRAMCANWDDMRSCCTAGGEDCDACAAFVRIRPQYCVRCGGTFYERTENRICAPCRAARKKQAQKKWRKLYGNQKLHN